MLHACRWIASLVLLAGAGVGCGQSAPGKAGPGAGVSSGPAPAASPLAGQQFYVNPQNHASVQVRQWQQQQGRAADAQKIEPIAQQPTATWFSGEPNPEAAVGSLTGAATADKKTPVVTVYDLPARDCGQYSSGGAPTPQAYLDYVGGVARGIRGSAVVILEPDAVPHALVGCTGAAPAQRYEMLSKAVDLLRARPGVHVYLDAGNASWIKDVDALAAALRLSGVTRAAGFSLNVANFETTAASVAYGQQLASRLAGAHFVIDTSRNGSGPATDTGDNHANWCNPPGRSLGTPPTTDTGTAGVDALLWVKQPGDSDGTCRPGAPPAGTWWPAYALSLVH